MRLPAALEISVRSAASISTEILIAITSTAEAETVRYAEAIRSASILCTDTSELARFLTTSV